MRSHCSAHQPVPGSCLRRCLPHHDSQVQLVYREREGSYRPYVSGLLCICYFGTVLNDFDPSGSKREHTGLPPSPHTVVSLGILLSRVRPEFSSCGNRPRYRDILRFAQCVGLPGC